MSTESIAAIAILTYRRHDLLARALRSAQAQRDIGEIIVADNAADPATAQLIRDQFAGVRYVAVPDNPGCEGRNFALREARAPIVITIDDDVELVGDDCIRRAAAAFQRDPSLAVLNFTVTGSDGSVLERDWCHPRPISHASREFETYFILEGASALRRDAVLAAGGYPANFFLGHEGVDLAFRLIERGLRIIHTPMISVIHRAASEHRPGWRMYYYYTRNGIWIAYRFYRPLRATIEAAANTAKMGFFAIRAGQFAAHLRGLWAGVREIPRLERSPLSPRSRARLKAIRAQRTPLLGRVRRHLSEQIL